MPTATTSAVDVSKAAVLITGAGNGIGRAAVVHCLKAGAKVTALDRDDGALKQLESEHGHSGSLLTFRCDVRDDKQQAAAFQAHMQRWRCLDVALLSAGISESGNIFEDTSSWQKTLDIDLRAVLVGVSLASRTMLQNRTRGAIVSIASAAGVFTMPHAPVYSAAKAGLLHFTRSAAPRLGAHGIRLCTICPQFVDTALVANLPADLRAYIARMGTLITPERVVEEFQNLLADAHANGVARVMAQNGQVMDWQPKTPSLLAGADQQRSKRVHTRGSPASETNTTQRPEPALPSSYRAWQVKQLSANFREAVRLVSLPMLQGLDGKLADHVLIKRKITGVNASDINFVSGKYHGSKEAAEKELPFVAGFESVGEVVRAGTKSDLRVGQPVATLTYGGFSEYALERSRFVVPLQEASAAAVSFLTSGLTASLALEQALGIPVSGDAEANRNALAGKSMLVTAAAGGTGLFAVQLAKRAGLTVIGTCGSDEKAALLTRVGVDRVVNYKAERLKEVLKKEFSGGVNYVYESVGGEMFDTAVNALATKGRLVIIGMMSQYSSGWPVSKHTGLPEKLLNKSASLTGFFLPHYASHCKRHLGVLFKLHSEGSLTVMLDKRSFVGIESVPDAVDHLQSGASSGKVVVYIDTDASQASTRARL